MTRSSATPCPSPCPCAPGTAVAWRCLGRATQALRERVRGGGGGEAGEQAGSHAHNVGAARGGLLLPPLLPLLPLLPLRLPQLLVLLLPLRLPQPLLPLRPLLPLPLPPAALLPLLLPQQPPPPRRPLAPQPRQPRVQLPTRRSRRGPQALAGEALCAAALQAPPPSGPRP